jgi:hypothetical protein
MIFGSVDEYGAGIRNGLGKPIFALTDKTGDPCRDALIDRVAGTPEDCKTMPVRGLVG